MRSHVTRAARRRRRFPFFLLATLGLIPAVSSAWSAEVGTLSGFVRDTQGDPVPFATVSVLGAGTGVQANGEGAFVVHAVPVGDWTIRARAAGKEQQDRRARIDAGRTTWLEFRMAERITRVPPIVVRPTMQGRIEGKESQIKSHVTSEELHGLPIQDLKDAIAMKAGVISHQGEIHFRGGRSDEVLTIVDGVPARNPLNSEGVELGILSVDTSDQIMGGLDARYGNALSGVVNLSTREGGDHFDGEVRYFTDRYGEADKSFTNYERLSLAVGGPFTLPRTYYFVSMEGTFSDTYLKSVATQKDHRLLDLVRLGNRQANEVRASGKLTYRVTPNSRINAEAIIRTGTHGAYHERWNRRGFVQVRDDSTAPTDGAVTHRYGEWAYYAIDSTFQAMNTAQHLPITDDDYVQVAATWKQTLSTKAFANVRLSRQSWKTTETVLDREPWEYQQEPNNYYDPTDRVAGDYYVTNGDYPYYLRRGTVTYTANGDFSARVDSTHSLTLGGEISYNELQSLDTTFPNVLDANGHYGATRDEFRAFNPEGSAFVQDRWEYEGMVLNAGIRYDSFSVGSQISSSEVADRVKTQWSPRIGIAYPISDRDVMSFHYGRLFQIPDRRRFYQGRGTISAEARGNPNLEPQTEIAYQLGVQHLLSREIFAQFGVYFKDTFGLLTTVPRQIPGYAQTVETYVNGDYASAKGMEFTVIKKRSHGFSGEINYTYGTATGTASDPNRALPTSANLRDQYKPTSEQPLEWDQRHTIAARLRIGNETDWGATFTYEFGSGFPYTPEMRAQRRQDPNAVNSGRLPSTSRLGVQAERMFRAWGQNVTLYLQGTNLLDTRNIAMLQPDLSPNNQAINSTSYVVYYTETGRAGGAFLTPDRDGDGREDWYPVNDPRVFEPGRVLRMGVGIQF